MRVKICGITRPDEIDLLGSLPVDFVGLWHAVPGGHADLPLTEFRRLAAAARATHSAQPVLVTFLDDAEALREVIHQSRVRWVQLHGYQTPTLVRAVKRAIPEEVRIIKVLRVQGASCLEAPLIRSYEKAGVDLGVSRWKQGPGLYERRSRPGELSRAPFSGCLWRFGSVDATGRGVRGKERGRGR